MRYVSIKGKVPSSYDRIVPPDFTKSAEIKTTAPVEPFLISKLAARANIVLHTHLECTGGHSSVVNYMYMEYYIL